MACGGRTGAAAGWRPGGTLPLAGPSPERHGHPTGAEVLSACAGILSMLGWVKVVQRHLFCVVALFCTLSKANWHMFCTMSLSEPNCIRSSTCRGQRLVGMQCPVLCRACYKRAKRGCKCMGWVCVYVCCVKVGAQLELASDQCQHRQVDRPT